MKYLSGFDVILLVSFSLGKLDALVYLLILTINSLLRVYSRLLFIKLIKLSLST